VYNENVKRDQLLLKLNNCFHIKYSTNSGNTRLQSTDYLIHRAN